MRRDVVESLFGPLEGLDLDHLLMQAGEAIVYVDSDWTVRYCNSIYLSNLGLSRSEVVGRTPFEYFPNFKRSIFYESIERCRLSPVRAACGRRPSPPRRPTSPAHRRS